MTAPPRRVLALSIAPGGRPIDDRLDAPPDPAPPFGLLGPDRFQRLHDEPDIDRLYRQRAEHRVDISVEGRRPLRGVPRVPPAGVVGGDIAFGAFPERQRHSRVEPRGRAYGLAFCERGN